jgi:uncharacterized membrane-anchored protein
MTRDHRLRAALTNEIHARPPLALTAPARASHLAMLSGEAGGEADRAHLSKLCAKLGHPLPAPLANHHFVDLGFARLKWERHTEFSSYTVLRDGCDRAAPFAETALDALPQDWVDELPGERLAATHIALLRGEAPAPDMLTRLFGSEGLVGARFDGGLAQGWTDFRLHGDGWGRILLHDLGLGAGQAGRLVQRLVEIEAYRILALLALPIAREVLPRLSAIERAVTAASQGTTVRSGLDDDRAILDELTRLAAACESIAAETGFRFAATRAYDALVNQRLTELREDRLEGLQTWGEFLSRRYAPAISTCDAVAARQEALSLRTARGANLLRTRVDVALEGQNAELLASMDRRAALQLRLQETVEGLSVVAISYYALALVGYAVKGLKLFRVEIDPELAVGVAVVPLTLVVWLALHRLKRRMGLKQ